MLTNKQEVIFFSSLGLLLVFFLTLVYIVGSRSGEVKVDVKAPNAPITIAEAPIEAKAAYVYDLQSGVVIYAKNEDMRLPLASLTKVMSALVARDSAPEYSTVVISTDAVKTDGDSGLYPGERWTLKDLLDFSLVSSANDGMRAIALTLGAISESAATEERIVEDFVSRMNEKARFLGMKNTYYFNDTGLDLPAGEVGQTSRGGAYGSAKDQALLLEHVLRTYPTLLSATKEPILTVTSLDGIKHIAKNTDTIIGAIPGLIASKTGLTDLAGGNLLVAYDPEIGRPIIISVLGSSVEGRFRDVSILVDLSLESVTNSVESHQ